MQKINSLYFSPTGGSKQVVKTISNHLYHKFNSDILKEEIDFTDPEIRKEKFTFQAEEIVIIAVPVYAGRVPNILLDFLNSISGNNTPAAAVVTYGNRNYDDALIELRDILVNNGFIVTAAAAFIGEHSFSETLAAGRPNKKDLQLAEKMGDKIYNKLKSQKKISNISVKGQRPYRDYYQPRDGEGKPINILKVKPKTDDSCIDCKLCVELCPMGSIEAQDVSKINGICIKCGACIKRCPVEAKYYDDQDYLYHKKDLEVTYKEDKEVELFLD